MTATIVIKSTVLKSYTAKTSAALGALNLIFRQNFYAKVAPLKTTCNPLVLWRA